MREPKQVIVVRKDLNMSPGKLAAQVAHASLTAFLSLFEVDLVNKQLTLPLGDPAYRDWQQESQVKIIVTVENEHELLTVYEHAQSAGVTRAIIKDEGRTELTGMNYTVVAVGPDHPDKINAITGGLPLL